MKKFLIKIDNLQFKLVKILILRLVRKYKYKHHKFYFLIRILVIDSILFVLCILVLTPLGMSLNRDEISRIIFHMFVWSILFFVTLLIIRLTIQVSQIYDFIWNLRKNPVVYQMEKESCKESFKKQRKTRLLLTSIRIFFLPPFILLFCIHSNNWLEMLLPLFLIIHFYITHFIHDYTLYVFDLEPPKKKKKKVKASDSLTEIMKGVFKKLIEGALKPVLQPQRI